LTLAPAYAADFQKGLDALYNGNYLAALIEWRPLAEQGHVMAQFNLGAMYFNDKGGVPQDYVEAEKWYRLAAEQGLDEAQISLG
jgi:TPR repeat protein